jgi:hypothetical protein
MLLASSWSSCIFDTFDHILINDSKEMKFNIYYFVYYILFKFSKIAAPKNYDIKDFADFAFLLLTLCVFLWILIFFLYFNIWNPLFDIKINFLIFLGILLSILYYLNLFTFIKNERYVQIELYYNKRLKLNNFVFVILALIILL